MKTPRPAENYEPALRTTEPEGGGTGIHVRRIVNEFHPIGIDVKGGSTIGTSIDSIIADALQNRGQVQALEVVITDEDWRALEREYYR